MGLLDEILGGAMEGTRGAPAAGPRRAQGSGGAGSVLAALLPIVLGMLMSRQGTSQGPGGLGGLLGELMGGGRGGHGGGMGQILEQFQRAGFGREADSWVSTGQNAPISPDAVRQVFGEDALSRIARQAGISEGETSRGLSELLPEVVDRVTPDGRVPDLDQLAASVDALRQRIGA
jgi:uncharacterized protein YidB (DUF937 family)